MLGTKVLTYSPPSNNNLTLIPTQAYYHLVSLHPTSTLVYAPFVTIATLSHHYPSFLFFDPINRGHKGRSWAVGEGRGIRGVRELWQMKEMLTKVSSCSITNGLVKYDFQNRPNVIGLYL